MALDAETTERAGGKTPVRATRGRLSLTLAAGAGVVATCLAPAALDSPASAAAPPTVRLDGTFHLCNVDTTPTTTAPPTTDPSVPTTLPPLAPDALVLIPPPSRVTLIRRGRVVAETWDVGYAIPHGYRHTGHPEGPSGFIAHFTLSAPPGRYLLRGIFGTRRVTLVAGRTTRTLVREGNCWSS